MIPDIIEIQANQSFPEKTRPVERVGKVVIDEPADNAVVDRKAALERTMGDEQFLSQLLQEFADWLVDMRERIGAAIADKDVKTLAKEANLLAGAAGNMGAEALSDAAFGLETASRKGVIQEVRLSFRKLEQEAESFAAYTRTI
jgi:HPt (histidine-containing phosphotransfer) domain-containing protein